MNEKSRFLRWAFRTVDAINRDMDIRMTPGDTMWRTAIVLLASARVGTSKAALVAHTSESPEFIARVCHAARKNKVWRGNSIRSEWPGENGDFAFMLDAMVVAKDGIMRAGDEATKKPKPRQSGKCACGRPSDRAGLVTCAACAGSIRRSHDRRKAIDRDSSVAPAKFKDILPLYQIDPKSPRP